MTFGWIEISDRTRARSVSGDPRGAGTFTLMPFVRPQIMKKIFTNKRYSGNATFKRSFEDATFVNCRFEDYVAQGANLMDTIFVHCSFRNVDFYWASMFRAQFIKCDLEEVSLRGANMNEVLFGDCRLVRCDFSHDNLGGNTDISSVTFHNSQRVECKYKRFRKGLTKPRRRRVKAR